MNFWQRLRYTFFIRGWGCLNVPMIAWLKPKVLEFGDDLVEIELPLRRRSKNHLKSMYFGALCAGADIASGMLAMHAISKDKLPVNLVFADLSAKFLKRAMGDTRFICRDGQKIKALVEETMRTGARVSGTVNVVATCPAISRDDEVAQFALTISIKRRSQT